MFLFIIFNNKCVTAITLKLLLMYTEGASSGNTLLQSEVKL